MGVRPPAEGLRGSAAFRRVPTFEQCVSGEHRLHSEGGRQFRSPFPHTPRGGGVGRRLTRVLWPDVCLRRGAAYVRTVTMSVSPSSRPRAAISARVSFRAAPSGADKPRSASASPVAFAGLNGALGGGRASNDGGSSKWRPHPEPTKRQLGLPTLWAHPRGESGAHPVNSRVTI